MTAPDIERVAGVLCERTRCLACAEGGDECDWLPDARAAYAAVLENLIANCDESPRSRIVWLRHIRARLEEGDGQRGS